MCHVVPFRVSDFSFLQFFKTKTEKQTDISALQTSRGGARAPAPGPGVTETDRWMG